MVYYKEETSVVHKFHHESVNGQLDLLFEGNDFKSGIKVQENLKVEWGMNLWEFFQLMKTVCMKNSWLNPQWIQFHYLCGTTESFNLEKDVNESFKYFTIQNFISKKGAINMISCVYELWINGINYQISPDLDPSFTLNQLNIESIRKEDMISSKNDKGLFFSRCKDTSIFQLLQHASLWSSEFVSCANFIVNCETICVPRSFTVAQLLSSIYDHLLSIHKIDHRHQKQSWLNQLLIHFGVTNGVKNDVSMKDFLKNHLLFMNKDGSTLSFVEGDQVIGERVNLKNFARVFVLYSTNPQFIQQYLYSNPSICDLKHLREMNEPSHNLDYTSFAIWAMWQFMRIYQKRDQMNKIIQLVKHAHTNQLISSKSVKGLPFLPCTVSLFNPFSMKIFESSILEKTDSSIEFYLWTLNKIHHNIFMQADSIKRFLKKIHDGNEIGKFVQMDNQNPKLRTIVLKISESFQLHFYFKSSNFFHLYFIF